MAPYSEAASKLCNVDDSASCLSDCEGAETKAETVFEDEPNSLGQKETKAVRWSRALMFGVLIAVAATLSTVTFMISTKSERKAFEAQFTSYATEIVDVSQSNAGDIFSSIESLSFTMTSYAIETKSSWPFVTHPHFEALGKYTCDLSGSVFVAYAPLVTESDRPSWETYATKNQGWISESLKEQGSNSVSPEKIYDHIYYANSLYKNEDGSINKESWVNEEGSKGFYTPVWQVSPLPHDTSYMNFNLLRHPAIPKFVNGMIDSRRAVISSLAPFGNAVDHLEHIRNKASQTNEARRLSTLYEEKLSEFPHSMMFQPVFEDTEKLFPVGLIMAVFPWDGYFAGVLNEGTDGVVVVADDSCGRTFSFQINGPDIEYLGLDDHHDNKYDSMVETTKFAPFSSFEADEFKTCDYTLRIYPSDEFACNYQTDRPLIYALVVLAVIIFTSVVFVMYDFLVERRQTKVLGTALDTNSIISSMFPPHARDRLLEEAEQKRLIETAEKKNRALGWIAPKTQLKTFLNDGVEKAIGDIVSRKPIADLFPDCTVMFADIKDFTSWSSVREPTQVFLLLEGVYAAMDEIAEQRGIFKVEVVGDSYVAVAGLQDSRKDHAVAMARFARHCLLRVNQVVVELQPQLGPGTGQLKMRFGLHSGPVTAGVLRGAKARFQLFGDTMNMASRMESTGEPNKIQVSEETARLLTQFGKERWLQPNTEFVDVKGKGLVRTYWLKVNNDATTASHVDLIDFYEDCGDENEIRNMQGGNDEMLANWNADILLGLLRQIVARRAGGTKTFKMKRETSFNGLKRSPSYRIEKELGTAIEEVKEVIALPKFDPRKAKNQEDPDTIVLDEAVVQQTRDYVRYIQTMYRDNPFHNFEHASHVTMSVVKLLSRIVMPADLTIDEGKGTDAFKQLHDHTYGITSDPLTQFAVVFSALIHDADHQGVTNTQLVTEQDDVATLYKNKSPAEQNSIEICWDLLMKDQFRDFRACLASTPKELERFRQIVVNCVIATDIMDKDQKTMRNNRWTKAFHESAQNEQEDVNRKATIVIEHLIQASDVAHTMQHWHVYRAWNEKLFAELTRAYKDGRADKAPDMSWYKGEMGFFDFYIIPLAKKLKECGVFGVSSDEYLNYALQNRAEWEKNGQQVVEEMLNKYS